MLKHLSLGDASFSYSCLSKAAVEEDSEIRSARKKVVMILSSSSLALLIKVNQASVQLTVDKTMISVAENRKPVGLPWTE